RSKNELSLLVCIPFCMNTEAIAILVLWLRETGREEDQLQCCRRNTSDRRSAKSGLASSCPQIFSAITE
ncbi:hypothetical protein BDV40DRAFT_281213, partial [Aspergillus tamarii]